MQRWRLSDLSFLAQHMRNSFVCQMVASTPQAYREAEKRSKELEDTIKSIMDKAKQDIAKGRSTDKKGQDDFWN